jgi:endonuclease YncB( thermonuclease family)
MARRSGRSLLALLVTIVTLAGAWFQGNGKLGDLWPTPAERRPSSATWEQLEGCRFLPHSGNDGDSFHAIHGGKEYIFRLYFVDAPETDDSYVERTADQAEYFGITKPEVMKLGQSAATFTRKRLEGRKFTIHTRWRDALGRSRLPRHYAFVEIGKEDLGELLVSNGLARIYGTRVTLPDGRDSRTYLRDLDRLEAEAKRRRLGGWRSLRTGFVTESASWLLARPRHRIVAR